MLNMIIFGPPGAGKGTQSSLIAKKYGLTHLSSGEILRQELKDGELGKEIKKYQEDGQLVPDSLIIEMIERTVRRKIGTNGVVLDGYPRTVKQAKTLDKFCHDHNIEISLILNLKLDEKTAAKRIILRGKTSGRADDNAATARKRFEVYRQETKPMLDYYRESDRLINIDGHPDIKTIFRSVQEQIKPVAQKLKNN
jgi:adenylate kinase